MTDAGRFGLSEALLADLRETFARFPEVQEVWLYGSRARGDFGPGSDIDLAIVAPGMSRERFAALYGALLDLPCAFPMDILRWEELEDADLRARILAQRRRLYP